LIKSIREELLNHTFFWSGCDLQAKLDLYQIYFNNSSHFGIDPNTPNSKCGKNTKLKDLNNYKWQKHLRG